MTYTDLKAIRALPKSDLHNHCLLGGSRSFLEQRLGKRLAPFRSSGNGIHDLNRWLFDEFRPVMMMPGTFEAAVEAAFVQALSDGVVILEMSIDAYFGKLFNISPEKMVNTLQYYHNTVAPAIEFRPEIGFPRNMRAGQLLPLVESLIELNYFRSVDLYDDEFAQPVANFREIYRLARKHGLKCKAHAGEFGTAESVREAVETLELDTVQHGIGAAGSPEVMKWLAINDISLNVCPASNIRLKRVKSYKTHPIRILFDHGVGVTVNTDDALIFGRGVSEQMKKLVSTGLFSHDEMELIRLKGLNS